MASAEETSVATASTLAPVSCAIFWPAAATAEASREAMDNCAPSSASARATAYPRPRLAPATIATLLVNPRIIRDSLSVYRLFCTLEVMIKLLLVSMIGSITALAQLSSNPVSPIREGLDRTEAVKITDNIYQAVGFGNTFLVTTPAGNVIIDTCNTVAAPLHRKLLKARSTGPVKYIILTHGHGDHTGGVDLWKEPGTQIIAQKNQTEF